MEDLAPTGLNLGHGDESGDPDARGMIRGLWDQFKDPATRSKAPGILCHLRPLENHILQSEGFKNAVDWAIEDLDPPIDYTALGIAPDHPIVPRDVARKWIKSTFLYTTACLLLIVFSEYHDCHQVTGPRTHLDKDFLMALPDLLETRHVQIDYTAQIIYYNVLLHGSMLDQEDFPTKREIVNRLSESCIRIGASWLELAGSTAADLSAACIMVRISLDS